MLSTRQRGWSRLEALLFDHDIAREPFEALSIASEPTAPGEGDVTDGPG